MKKSFPDVCKSRISSNYLNEFLRTYTNGIACVEYNGLDYITHGFILWNISNEYAYIHVVCSRSNVGKKLMYLAEEYIRMNPSINYIYLEAYRD